MLVVAANTDLGPSKDETGGTRVSRVNASPARTERVRAIADSFAGFAIFSTPNHPPIRHRPRNRKPRSNDQVRWKKSQKNKRSVDAFPVFRLQPMFHTSNSTSLTAHEKEIHFQIRVF